MPYLAKKLSVVVSSGTLALLGAGGIAWAESSPSSASTSAVGAACGHHGAVSASDHGRNHPHHHRPACTVVSQSTTTSAPSTTSSSTSTTSSTFSTSSTMAPLSTVTTVAGDFVLTRPDAEQPAPGPPETDKTVVAPNDRSGTEAPDTTEPAPVAPVVPPTTEAPTSVAPAPSSTTTAPARTDDGQTRPGSGTSCSPGDGQVRSSPGAAGGGGQPSGR